jgi:hypothetical protein
MANATLRYHFWAGLKAKLLIVFWGWAFCLSLSLFSRKETERLFRINLYYFVLYLLIIGLTHCTNSP